MELSLVRSLMDRTFYEEHRGARCPDRLFSKELRGHVDNVKILRLTDDLKYSREIDIQNLKRMGDTAWN